MDFLLELREQIQMVGTMALQTVRTFPFFPSAISLMVCWCIFFFLRWAPLGAEWHTRQRYKIRSLWQGMSFFCWCFPPYIAKAIFVFLTEQIVVTVGWMHPCVAHVNLLVGVFRNSFHFSWQLTCCMLKAAPPLLTVTQPCPKKSRTSWLWVSFRLEVYMSFGVQHKPNCSKEKEHFSVYLNNCFCECLKSLSSQWCQHSLVWGSDCWVGVICHCSWGSSTEDNRIRYLTLQLKAGVRSGTSEAARHLEGNLLRESRTPVFPTKKQIVHLPQVKGYLWILHNALTLIFLSQFVRDISFCLFSGGKL